MNTGQPVRHETLEPRLLLSGTVYVVESLSDVYEEDGCLTLREAIAAANWNEEVHDAPAGSSTETDIIQFHPFLTAACPVDIVAESEWSVADDLAIYGPGADLLTLTNEGGAVFNVREGGTLLLDGLKISNSSDGVTAALNSSLTITNCVFVENRLYGIDSDGDVTLAGCSISGTGRQAVRAYGNCVVEDSVIAGNSSSRPGVISCSGATLKIVNSAIVANTMLRPQDSLIEAQPDTQVSVINSTIVNNYWPEEWGGAVIGAGQVTLSNSIVAMNSGEDVAVAFSGGSNLIGGDPGFVRNPNPGRDGEWGSDDDDFGDLRLAYGSPCIDAGDSAAAVDSTGTPLVADLAGEWRIVGGGVDIGAYETQRIRGDIDDDGDVDLADFTILKSNFGMQSATAADGDVNGDQAVSRDDFAILKSTFGLGVPLGSVPVDEPGPAMVEEPAEPVLFPQPWENPDSQSPAEGTVYTITTTRDCVDVDGDISLREAIEAANTNAPVGDAPAGSDTAVDVIQFPDCSDVSHIIWWRLSQGQLRITDDLKIQGSSPETLGIDGGGNSRVFEIAEGVSVTIAGIMVYRGLVDVGNGGGLYSEPGSTVVLEDMVFLENKATASSGRGGAIYCEGQTTVDHVQFVRNESQLDGGGIYNAGDMALLNCQVNANSVDYRGEGSGIYSKGSLAVIGTSFVMNSLYTESQADLLHCTMATGFEVNFISPENGVAIRNSIVFVGHYRSPIMIDNFTDIESCLIGLDPLFVRNPSPGDDGRWGTWDDDYGDLRLTERSIALDCGNNDLAYGLDGSALTFDCEGQPRIVNGTVDVGAYEFQGEPAEGRETPSLLVTTAADVCDAYDGEISLREAIQYASWLGPDSRITFESALADQGISVYGNPLEVREGMIIDGGDLGITIDAHYKTGPMIVFDASPVLIRGLDFVHGAISECWGTWPNLLSSNSDLTLERCAFYDGGGCGLIVGGSTKMLDCEVFDNREGGLGACGQVLIDGSIIRDNRYSRLLGMGVSFGGGHMTIKNSLIAGNNADEYGGGIYCHGSSTSMSIVDTTITGNFNGGDAGGIYVKDSILYLNRVDVRDNYGTGVCGEDAFIKVCDSRLTGNLGSALAAVSSHFDIVDSEISENVGMALYVDGGEVDITGTLIRKNNTDGASHRSGVYVSQADLRMTDSVIMQNPGGGIWGNDSNVLLSQCRVLGNVGDRAGIYVDIDPETDCEVDLINSEIVGNVGGGVWVDGPLQITNCTVAANTSDSVGGVFAMFDAEHQPENCILAFNAGVPIVGAVWTMSNLIDVDPEFLRDPSAGPDGEWGTDDDDYGDLRLKAYSPAVDAGDDDGAMNEYGRPLLRDFFGNPRNSRSAVDIGAHELFHVYGDVDLDGDIDLDDFVVLKTHFGQPACVWDEGDFTGDGRIDLEDFVLLKQHFGFVFAEESSSAPVDVQAEAVETETTATEAAAPVWQQQAGTDRPSRLGGRSVLEAMRARRLGEDGPGVLEVRPLRLAM